MPYPPYFFPLGVSQLPESAVRLGVFSGAGTHVMMFLDLIGRVAGNGNNKVLDLDPIPLNGV